MPRPPEYCGSAAVIPYSGEKYATAAGPACGVPFVVWPFVVWPASAYQRGPDM